MSFRPFVLLMLQWLVTISRLAAQSVTEAEIRAGVIPVIGATNVTQLNFGNFSVQAQGGQLTITPDGKVSTSGGVIASGSPQPATFIITGEDKFTFSILLPDKPVTIYNTCLAKGLTVSAWSSSPCMETGSELLANGAQEIKIGARLNVGPIENNPAGLYEGVFIVKFNYN